ncbi:MAG: DNA mismatch repair protein MutS [Anaerolineae bacterium]|nr:DNA mismatch repair protein MutS [Anaerolineae bacterium]
MSAKAQPTKSRRQYLDTKAQYPDAILFFRLGDFYEMFDEDAKIAAKELDLVLTARKQRGSKIPMAGVPYHAAENYIARLIAKGYKVAVCEQIGSQLVNGIMPREVVRVFTAGTVIEPGMLDAGRPNYLGAVVRDGDRAGLAYADITTGEFATTQLDTRRQLIEELARLDLAELLVPDNELTLGNEAQVVQHYPTLRFEESYARQTLLRHFGVSTLDGFGCEGKPLAVRAAGAVLAYLLDTQKGALDQIQRLATYHTGRYMALGRSARRSLELTESLAGEKAYSLLGVLDATVTSMGARLLRERITRPLLDVGELETRLDQVDAFFGDGLLRADVRKLLRTVPDLERLTNRIVGGKASPRDVEHVALVLETMPELKGVLRLNSAVTGGSDSADALPVLADALDAVTEAQTLIRAALQDDAPPNMMKIGVIKKGFSAELDGIMNSSKHAREWISQLEPRERERTGIDKLKVGYNKVFGYYIEVTRANANRVPEDYIRKQTLVNAERYITPELKEYETLVLNAEDRILEIERRIFGEVIVQVAGYGKRLLQTAHALAQIDVAAALAEVAANQGYVRPKLTTHIELDMRQGRHPVVENTLELERFVANDTLIGFDDRIHLITGPNMSGKSTYLRQVALITLMAQIGSFVSAEAATIGLVDRIFTRIGAHDELHAGRSTFMVEMVETAEIMHHATPRSLLILDEIGRGTSTYDGLSIAWALVEYLHNHPQLKPRTLFATHYHELTGLADMLPLVENYNVAVAGEGDEVVFLHQIVPGGADQSYGIHVAQLAGLPRDVINRANEILVDLEKHAPTATVEPSRLNQVAQAALFPESSPILDELDKLDVMAMTPLEAINKLYEWKRRYGNSQ